MVDMKTNRYKLEDSIGYLTGSLSRKMIAKNVESFTSAGLSLSSNQFIVLIHLWSKDGVSQQTVADHMKIDKGSFTRIIVKLEMDGLLYRRENPDNAREKLMYLTVKGRSVMDHATELVQKVLNRSYSGIDPEQLNICRNVLRQIHSNLA